MADVVDALTWKLQSKICYHRDANVEYLEIQALVDKLVKENKKFQDENMEYLDMIDRLIEEQENFERDYQAINEQVAPLEEQLETVKKELAVATEQLAEVKYEHVAANHETVVSKEELLIAREQLSRNNEELEVLRKKLQESEAMQTRLQQQKGKAPGPQPVHFGRVTRSTYKRDMLLQGSLATDTHTNAQPEVARKVSKRARKPNPRVSGDCWAGGGYIGV